MEHQLYQYHQLDCVGPQLCQYHLFDHSCASATSLTTAVPVPPVVEPQLYQCHHFQFEYGTTAMAVLPVWPWSHSLPVPPVPVSTWSHSCASTTSLNVESQLCQCHQFEHSCASVTSTTHLVMEPQLCEYHPFGCGAAAVLVPPIWLWSRSCASTTHLVVEPQLC